MHISLYESLLSIHVYGHISSTYNCSGFKNSIQRWIWIFTYTIGSSHHRFHSPVDRGGLVRWLRNTFLMQFFCTEVNDTNDHSLMRFRIGLCFITSSNRHINTHWISTVPRSSHTGDWNYFSPWQDFDGNGGVNNVHTSTRVLRSQHQYWRVLCQNPTPSDTTYLYIRWRPHRWPLMRAGTPTLDESRLRNNHAGDWRLRCCQSWDGGGLWSWGEWRWNGGITHNKHPEDSKPTRQPETSILHQIWAEEQESAHDSGAMAEEPYLRTRRRQHNIKPQQSISSSSIAPLLWISVQKPKGLSDEIIDKLSHQHEPAVLSIILFQRLSSVRIPQYNGCTTAVSNRTRNGSITPTNFASIQSTLDRNNFLPFSHEVMTGLELMTWGSFLWLCVSSSNFNKSYSKGHCIFSKGLYDRQNYNDA